jgi:hypothetical protein
MAKKTMDKQIEFDRSELSDNKCKIFEIGGKKGAICLENGKITIYELNSGKD